ncbi:MAG: type II toxin-antitoxin system ParD family antitoxin [Rhodospirillales bacterium]
MNFSLTPSLEQFVRDRAASGNYNTASEVVREALRLLQRTEEEHALKLAHLRNAVAAGDAAVAAGDVTEIATDDDLDALFDRL